MFVDFEYNPLIEDFNKDGSLKLESVLKILENSGNKHSDKSGDYILEGSNNGVTWVLTDWYVEVESFPKYGDKILARTWSQNPDSLFGCPRDFELYANDKLCIKGTTYWVLFDLNRGRPAKITPELISKYNPEEKSVFEEKKITKLSIPENFTSEVIIKPRRNDIDFNGHVHNLVYIDYAMEAIPEEVYKAHLFKSIRINYKSAITDISDITVKYAYVDDTHKVCIYDNKGDVKTIIQIK